MARRVILCAVVIVVVIAFSGVAWWNRPGAPPHIDVAERRIRERIDGAGLTGAPPSKVAKFLDEEGILHTDYRRNDPVGEYDRTITATIAGAGSGFISVMPVDYDMIIIFYFDENDRLTRYVVKSHAITF